MTRKIYTVKVTDDCTELLTAMPRGFEIELVSEDYAEDNESVIIFEAEESDAIERALDSHRGVVSFDVKDAN